MTIKRSIPASGNPPQMPLGDESRPRRGLSRRDLRRAVLVQNVAVGIAVAIGLLGIVGNLTRRLEIAAVFPGREPVSTAASICVVLLGVAIVLARRGTGPFRLAASALALIVALVASFDLGHFVLHPEHWAITEADAAFIGMAPVTAIILLLLSIAVALPARARLPQVATAIGMVAGLVIIVVLLGYVFEVATFVSTSIQLVPVHAASVALFLLLIAALLLEPQRGWTGLALSKTPAGTLLRLLVPASLIVPLLIEAARRHAVDERWVSRELSSAVASGIQMLFLTSLAVGTAFLLRRRDEMRRDLEERFRAELERLVERRTAELAEANRELEAFAYSVSHDLRAPLRSMEGFTRLLLEDSVKLPPQTLDYLERIRRASQTMGQLIEDMLWLSRVTRQEMRVGRVDLSALARSVASELAAEEPERQVEVSIEDGLECEGDAALLKIVLQNLLANAWKFTSKKPRARIDVGAQNGNGSQTFFVRDDGAGFDPRHAAKLFSPFQRLHRADEFEGTGIGLATVQRIIRRHGGFVHVEGRPNEGATVRFTLGRGREA